MLASTSARRWAAADARSPPTTIVVRDATVGPLSGTSDVSRGATSTSSWLMPRASATIWASTVRDPCPISVLAVSARTRPSAVSSTETTLASFVSPEPVNPPPCQPSAIPIPDADRAPGVAPSCASRNRRTRSNPAAAAAASRTSTAATLSRRTWPVAVVSPTR